MKIFLGHIHKKHHLHEHAHKHKKHKHGNNKHHDETNLETLKNELRNMELSHGHGSGLKRRKKIVI